MLLITFVTCLDCESGPTATGSLLPDIGWISGERESVCVREREREREREDGQREGGGRGERHLVSTLSLFR